jgi:hypothetical protein
MRQTFARRRIRSPNEVPLVQTSAYWENAMCAAQIRAVTHGE